MFLKIKPYQSTLSPTALDIAQTLLRDWRDHVLSTTIPGVLVGHMPDQQYDPKIAISRRNNPQHLARRRAWYGNPIVPM